MHSFAWKKWNISIKATLPETLNALLLQLVFCCNSNFTFFDNRKISDSFQNHAIRRRSFLVKVDKSNVLTEHGGLSTYFFSFMNIFPYDDEWMKKYFLYLVTSFFNVLDWEIQRKQVYKCKTLIDNNQANVACTYRHWCVKQTVKIL